MGSRKSAYIHNNNGTSRPKEIRQQTNASKPWHICKDTADSHDHAHLHFPLKTAHELKILTTQAVPCTTFARSS